MKILWVESRDFSQAEKDKTACKAEQIHRMTPIFTQNNNLSENSCHFCEFAQFRKQSFARLKSEHLAQFFWWNLNLRELFWRWGTGEVAAGSKKPNRSTLAQISNYLFYIKGAHRRTLLEGTWATSAKVLWPAYFHEFFLFPKWHGISV